MSKEYVLKKLESLGLIDKNQITQASATMFTSSAEEDGFPICELSLKGIGPKYEADIISVTVKFDGNTVKEAELPVVKGDFDRYFIKIKKETIEKLRNDSAECTVTAVDKYGRELVSAVSAIEFNIQRTEPSFDCDIQFRDEVTISDGDIRTEVAELYLSSTLPAVVSVELFDSETLLWQNNINIADEAISQKISADSVNLVHEQSEFIIRLKSNGKIIAEKKATVRILREGPEEDISVKELPNIVGDFVLPEYVDTHTVIDDSVEIGSLVLFNKGECAEIMISVILDGTDLLCTREQIPDDRKEICIEAPFVKLARGDTHVSEIIAHVTDTAGNTLIHRVASLKVRSKYDMDLRELCLRTAQFVNPCNIAVEEMVNSSDSLLASSMAGRYTVQGYQNGGKDIMRQMEAAYLMMHNIGMRYVSDTFAFSGSSDCYQHVRTPDKILADKSGNCLEFCILYASVMEAMGLECVIAFPPGHSIVGVVLETDLYETESNYDGPDDAPYIMMDVDGKQAFVMFVETTMCPSCGYFAEAVGRGYSEIEENLNYVCQPKNHVFIKQMRLKGTNPIISL